MSSASTRASTPRAPPPRATRPATARVGQRQDLGARGARMRSAAAGGVAHVARAAICAIMSGGSTSATKPAAGAHHLRGVRRRGDDARLLDDHRHDVVVPVDAHVERDAVGQRVGAEDVLDELVGGLGVEAPRLERALDVARVGARRLAHEGAALLRR